MREISIRQSISLDACQKVMLRELAAIGPRSQAMIADLLGCEAPTVTIIAKKRETAGLIIRTQAPVDARVNLVDLTDKGRALIPRLNDAWLALARDTIAGLKESSTAEVLTVLDDLTRSLYGTRDIAGGAGTDTDSRLTCHAEGAS